MIQVFFMFLAAMLALCPLTAEASPFGDRVANMAKINAVRIMGASDHMRIVLDATREVDYKTIVLKEPGRIVITLENAWLNPLVARDTPLSSRFASKVRIGQFDKTTVRLVVETEVGRDNYEVFSLDGGAVPYRVVLDLGKLDTGSTDVTHYGVERKDAESEERDESDEEKKPVALKKENRIFPPGLKGKKIAIDPGHGGEDTGAIGPSGVTEKSVTLRITKELKALLEDEGAEVILTRDRDTEVSPKHRAANDLEELQARCDIANNADADIFLSIHLDSFTSADPKGTTGFYYEKGTEAGKRLAHAVQKGVVKALGTHSRGVKSCNFYVLKHTAMPSTLIEVAFLSYPPEEKLMNSPEGVTKAANGIAEGLAEFFSE